MKLVELLPDLEKAANMGKDIDVSKHMKQRESYLRTRNIYGYPLNVPYTDIDGVLDQIKITGVHECTHPEAQFGLGVGIFPYPSNVYSVWIYLVTLIPK